MGTNHSQGQKIRYIRQREIENAASVGEAIGLARKCMSTCDDMQKRIDTLELQVTTLSAAVSALIDMVAKAQHVS